MRDHQSGIRPGPANELKPPEVLLEVLGLSCSVVSREQKITLDSALAPRGVA